MILDVKFTGKRKYGESYQANGKYDTDKNEFTILAKSKWASKVDDPGIDRNRQDLISNGIVDKGTGIFLQDYICTPKQQNGSGTPISNASQIICGTPRDVTSWKMKSNNKKLYDYLEEIGVVKKKGKARQFVPLEDRNKYSFSEDNGQGKESFLKVQADYLHQNIIFYGVPGCGKSHRINELLHLDDEENGLKKEYYKRILFHPEYSYSDFVGQLRPEVGDDNKITYKFAPGAFTEILRDAYKDREHEYFLIIEEINRGNAPAIFGDLFQLLDRKDGVSEYSIDNKDILDYFKRESEQDDTGAMAQIVESIKTDGIRIPKNLTIFATMNTCDQNVFTLDTAFKRRWRMSRIVNDFDKDSSISEWKISFKSGGFSWKEFAKAVNDAILNNCNDGTAAEDKQLGTHFIKQCDLTPARRFAEKVLLYLWDDVAKYDKSQLFDTNKYKTLDMVIDGFVEGENVFSPNCAQLQELYNHMKQPEQTDENAAGVPSGADPGTDSSVKNAHEAADEVQGIE